MSETVDIPLELYDVFVKSQSYSLQDNTLEMKEQLFKIHQMIHSQLDYSKIVKMNANVWQQVLSASIACHVGDYGSAYAALNKAHLLEKENISLN